MTFYTDSAEQTIEFGKKIGSKLKKGDILAMQELLRQEKQQSQRELLSLSELKILLQARHSAS